MKIDKISLEGIFTNLLNNAKPQSMLFMYLELFQTCIYTSFTYIYEKNMKYISNLYIYMPYLFCSRIQMQLSLLDLFMKQQITSLFLNNI